VVVGNPTAPVLPLRSQVRYLSLSDFFLLVPLVECLRPSPDEGLTARLPTISNPSKSLTKRNTLNTPLKQMPMIGHYLA
jgi:hypothetical protein